MLTPENKKIISYAITDSNQRDRVEDLFFSNDITLQDVLEVCEEMVYEVDFCEFNEFWDIWGWTEGVTDEGCQDWRIKLNK